MAEEGFVVVRRLQIGIRGGCGKFSDFDMCRCCGDVTSSAFMAGGKVFQLGCHVLYEGEA